MPSDAPRRALPVAALLAILSLAGGAHAQVAQPTVTLTTDAQGFTLEPGAEARATITVESTSTLPGGTVQLAVEPAERDGWTASLDPSQVPAGQTSSVTMTIRAPPSREGFPTAFPVTVTGTLATQSGTASDRVTFQNQLAAAPPPPPPPEFPWIPVLGVALLLAIAGAFGAMTWRREGGIELAAKAAEQDARPGADTFVPLEIRNTSGRPRVARVTAEGLPPGWTAATNRDEIPLDPGQSEPLWLAVRPPAGAEAGLTTVSILAKPREAKKARQATKVRIKVVPEAGVSGQDFVRPSFLPSDRPPGA